MPMRSLGGALAGGTAPAARLRPLAAVSGTRRDDTTLNGKRAATEHHLGSA